jgi:hypothetical protein
MIWSKRNNRNSLINRSLPASVHSGDVNLHNYNPSVSCSSCILKTRFIEGSKLCYEQVTAENIITTNLLKLTGYVMHQQV